MLKKMVFAAIALLLVSACAEKRNGTGNNSSLVPPGEEKKAEAPKSPTDSTQTILEGTWVGGCIYKLDEKNEYYSYIATVVVKGNSLTYQEEVFDGQYCSEDHSQGVQYSISRHIKVVESNDYTYSHTVQYVDANNKVTYEWSLVYGVNYFYSNDDVLYNKK